MQAKNYAAQAVTSIDANYLTTIYKDAGLSFHRTKDSVSLLAVRSLMNDSKANFSLPVGGVIFDDRLKGLDKELFLPFDIFTISFDTDVNTFQDGRKYKVVCLISKLQHQGKNHAIISPFIKRDIEKEWVCLGSSANVVLSDWGKYNDDGLFLNGNFNIYLKELLSKSKNPKDFEYMASAICKFSAMALLELLEALNCTNVEQSIIQAVDSGLNNRRVKKGKIPLLDERILTIRTKQKTSLDFKWHGGIGGHASPRQHLRRGHIRRLPTGNIFVQSCVVGSAADGIIKKDYKVV